MAFTKGNRTSPGMVVVTGEHPRLGKRSGSCLAGGEAKELIFGAVPPPGPLRASRPPPQPTHVDATTGPAAATLQSKVGPGRERRPADEAALETRRRYNEAAAQAFRDARATRQQTKDAQGKGAVPFACAEPSERGDAAEEERPQSFGRRPSRERREAPKVDAETAALLQGIERSATASQAMVAEAFRDSQAVAEKGRARNRGHDIFGEAPLEELTIRREAAGPRQPWDPEAAAGFDEARQQRAQALARGRGAAGGIFACDEPRPAPPPRNGAANIISW